MYVLDKLMDMTDIVPVSWFLLSLVIKIAMIRLRGLVSYSYGKAVTKISQFIHWKFGSIHRFGSPIDGWPDVHCWCCYIDNHVSGLSTAVIRFYPTLLLLTTLAFNEMHKRPPRIQRSVNTCITWTLNAEGGMRPPWKKSTSFQLLPWIYKSLVGH
jgi:hypothetical protein